MVKSMFLLKKIEHFLYIIMNNPASLLSCILVWHGLEVFYLGQKFVYLKTKIRLFSESLKKAAKFLDSGKKISRLELAAPSRLELASCLNRTARICKQQSMKGNAADFYRCLEDGAMICVCTADKNITKKAEQAQCSIIRNVGNYTERGKAVYLSQLNSLNRIRC